MPFCNLFMGRDDTCTKEAQSEHETNMLLFSIT